MAEWWNSQRVGRPHSPLELFMPTLTRPLPHVPWQILKLQNAYQKRRIAIFKEIGLDADTEKNIEAYEKRHQRFLQALRGDSKLSEKINVVGGETTESASTEGLVKAGVDGESSRQHTVGRKPWTDNVEFEDWGSKLGSKPQGSLKGKAARKSFFNAHCSPESHGFRRWSPPRWAPDVTAEPPQHTEIQNGFRTPCPSPSKPIDPVKVGPGQHQGRPPRTKISLFEELFPDEVENPATKAQSSRRTVPKLPKLTLPDLEGDDESFGDDYVNRRRLHEETTEVASKEAYKHWNLAILVLQVASPSLTEGDFRRIAPKGQHISDWVGPGDIFKVIPARNPTTLRQETHYFLVFPNPAYARAYQNHVCRLHGLAQSHTPTSIESTMAPPEGMVVQGEDVHDILQNYALLPFSQKMDLISLFPPYSTSVRRLLDRRGYPELKTPKDKTGRCVLFWVDGFVPTMVQVRQFISLDNRARGLAWALLDGKNSIQQLDTDADPDLEAESEVRMRMERQQADPGHRMQEFFDYARRKLMRWTIAFEDENEARRFVRRWHLRPFSDVFTERERKGDVKPLVHAEFMW